MEGGRAHPFSCLVDGNGGPAGEQDTVTRDALLTLHPLHTVCIVFPCPAPKRCHLWRDGWWSHCKQIRSAMSALVVSASGHSSGAIV